MTKRAKNPLIPSYNVRHDGWTHARTKTFLATLRQTGCVTDAARVVGMSTASGYRLRKRDAVFRAAWDEALLDARRGLIAVAHERAVVGKEVVIYRNGKEYERRIAPDSSILALLIKHGDLGGDGARIGNRTADKLLTVEERRQGYDFDDAGEKVDRTEHHNRVRQKLDDKINQMRERMHTRGDRTVNVKTGEGFTAEVLAAARRFGGGGGVPLLEDRRDSF